MDSTHLGGLIFGVPPKVYEGMPLLVRGGRIDGDGVTGLTEIVSTPLDPNTVDTCC